MWAAGTCKCDVVTELISLGADVDVQTNVSQFPMSHHLQSGSEPSNVVRVHSVLLELLASRSEPTKWRNFSIYIIM